MNIDQQIDCVRNEIKRRKKLYTRLIEEGKMQQDYADLEVTKMQAVFQTLTQLKGLVCR